MEEWGRLGPLIGLAAWKRQSRSTQGDRLDRWFVLGAVLGAVFIAATYFLLSRMIID
jgi:uncharacterized membrane protein YdcZ (DUF606 family)